MRCLSDDFADTLIDALMSCRHDFTLPSTIVAGYAMLIVALLY